jgi:hypothetical protein
VAQAFLNDNAGIWRFTLEIHMDDCPLVRLAINLKILQNFELSGQVAMSTTSLPNMPHAPLDPQRRKPPERTSLE